MMVACQRCGHVYDRDTIDHCFACGDGRTVYVPMTLHTRSGRRLDLRKPSEDDITIEDIAAGLSKICRFAGHVTKFYSVAQHAVLVSHGVDEKFALQGLLHDGSEAYLADLPRNLKRSQELAGYRGVEDRFQKVINSKFGLPEDFDTTIHEFDRWIAGFELKALFTSPLPGFLPYGPEESEQLFLARFAELTRTKTWTGITTGFKC